MKLLDEAMPCKPLDYLVGLFAPNKIGPLRAFNPKELYIMGGWLHRLRQIKTGDTLHKHADVIRQIGFLCENFYKNPLNQKFLPHAVEKSAELQRWLLALLETNPNWPINQESLDLLTDKGILSSFESALTMELDHLPLYLLERKCGYAVEVLLADIEEVLPQEDREGLSDFARDNMQEAGACMAFHRFTACGYHMARAVEDVARRYYELIKGQSQKMSPKIGDARERDRTLAQIAGELDDILKNWKKGEPGLLSLIVPTLRNFCRIYRHPLSHADPELKELEPNEAETAFRHAINAISTVLEDVRIGGPHFALQFHNFQRLGFGTF